MNEVWNSFLQTVFQFVKSLFGKVSKKMHRNAVVLTTGIAVVTVLTFTASDFEGGGKSALIAFAETPQEPDGAGAEQEESMESSDFQGTETGVSEENQQEPEDKEEIQSAKEAAGKDEGSEENSGQEKAVETEEEDRKEAYVCSEKDYKVLLKIVQAEAGDCDTKGRILVANVVLNRVESEEFPDTISGVVYERSQFSPVSNGTINSCKVTQETVEAVNRALAGEDYSEGALYFMNRKASSGRNVRWFDTHLDYLFKHEGHEFFK